MAQRNHLFNGANLTVGIIGLLIAAVSLAVATGFGWPSRLFGDKDRFYCKLQPDTSLGGNIWTVIYRHEKGEQPWLKMVTTLGGNWTPQERCNEIAHRLEMYRQDGLTQLSYHADPNTPSQYVICAKTKLDLNNCHLVITLKPDAKPYETLREMTAATALGSSGVVQSSQESSSSSLSPHSLVINLEDQLTADDLKAGSATTK